MKTILVLGAGGFIGKSLVKSLKKRYHIKAFDRYHMPFYDEFKNVEQFIGDFKDISLVDRALRDTDIVIHLISTTIPTDVTIAIDKEIEDNIIPTVNLLNSMVKNKVKNIIFSSSAGTIYGETGDLVNGVNAIINPSCSYGVQKACIESYIKFFGYRYGLNYRIMRISNPYGIGQDNKKPQGLIPIAMNKLLNNEEITIFGDGSNMRDYIYLDDLIDCFEKVIEYDGDKHVFNIGFGAYYSINDILKLLEENLGQTFINKKYQPKRMCDVNRSFLDFESSQKELKWKPKVGINEGILKLYSIILKMRVENV